MYCSGRRWLSRKVGSLGRLWENSCLRENWPINPSQNYLPPGVGATEHLTVLKYVLYILASNSEAIVSVMYSSGRRWVSIKVGSLGRLWENPCLRENRPIHPSHNYLPLGVGAIQPLTVLKYDLYILASNSEAIVSLMYCSSRRWVSRKVGSLGRLSENPCLPIFGPFILSP